MYNRFYYRFSIKISKMSQPFYERIHNFSTSYKKRQDERNRNVAYYMTALTIGVFGLSYASVPLYKVFCQMTGFGGTTQRADAIKAITVKPVVDAKLIKITFTSSVHSNMPWKFKPTQQSIKIVPGETALAFYTVTNTADYAITGVATYNVSTLHSTTSNTKLLTLHTILHI